MIGTLKSHWGNARRVLGVADTLAAKRRELNEAQMQLMTSQSQMEYDQAMVAYNTKRCARLKADIIKEEDERRVVELAAREKSQTTNMVPL